MVMRDLPIGMGLTSAHLTRGTSQLQDQDPVFCNLRFPFNLSYQQQRGWVPLARQTLQGTGSHFEPVTTMREVERVLNVLRGHAAGEVRDDLLWIQP